MIRGMTIGLRETGIGRRIHSEATHTWLAQLHQCSCCREPIEDDYYYRIGADYYCPECMDKFKRKNERS